MFCFEQLQDYHPQKNLAVEKNKKGLLFEIGNRRSVRYYRIYTIDNFLRFEFKIKRNFIKNFHNLLTEYRLEKFEITLSHAFFKYSFEIFSCCRYLDNINWLINRICPYQYKNKLFSETLVINSLLIIH